MCILSAICVKFLIQEAGKFIYKLRFCRCRGCVAELHGETTDYCTTFFSDFWNINIDKKLIHTEAINTGLFEKKYLNSFSTLNNNSAVATIIIVGNKFLNNVNNLSETLTNNENTTSNYSHWDNKLIVRLLSKDSYNLKFAIDKILSYFFEGSKIPKVWNI